MSLHQVAVINHFFCTSRATSCCNLMQYRCNRSQRQVAATNHLAWPREFLCTEIFDRILSSTQFAKSNQLECVNLCLVARQIISQNDHCRHEAICLCDLSPNVFRPLILIFHPSLPSPSPLIPFFLLLSQLSRRTRAETLAMQANRMCNTIADRPESFRRHALGAIRATEQRHDVSVILLASGNIYWQYTISVCDHFHSPFFSLPDNTPCLPPPPPRPPQKNRKKEGKRNSHKHLFSLSPGYCNAYAKFRGVSEVYYGQCESGEYVRTGSVRSCRRSSWIIWKLYLKWDFTKFLSFSFRR